VIAIVVNDSSMLGVAGGASGQAALAHRLAVDITATTVPLESRITLSLAKGVAAVAPTQYKDGGFLCC
jgi:hypothetical protein